MKQGPDVPPTARTQTGAPVFAAAGWPARRSRDHNSGGVASDSARKGFQVSTSVLSEASSVVRGSVAEVAATATLAAAATSEEVAGAAGGAKPAGAMRRFFDTAQRGVRQVLADESTLAAHLRESAIGYERIEHSVATLLNEGVHAPPAPVESSAVDIGLAVPDVGHDDQDHAEHIPEPGVVAGLPTDTSAAARGGYRPGEIFSALCPGASAEEIEHYRNGGR